jgi:hypothetical protein
VRRGFESRLRLSVKASGSLIAIVLALVAAGCGGEDNGEAAQDRPAPKLVESTVVRGGPERERALLRRVLRGMQKTTLKQIVIGPLEARGKAKGRAPVPLTFTVAPGGPSVRRQWDEWIVAGAFSRRLLAAGLSARVDAADREGGFTARPKVPRQPDPRPLSRRQETAVVKGIRSAARRSGGNVVRLEVHRPYGVAVALSVAAEDPARFLKNKLRPLIGKLAVHRPRLEGMYLAVLDKRRRLTLEWGAWTRNPAGTYWVRRDLANCSPIEQSEPPGTKKPPPCPA